MELIVISLLAGCLLGVSNRIDKRWIGHLDKVVFLVVFILLTVVGVGIGSNREIVANLTLLGWKAMVIAALSTIGSVVVLWALVSKSSFLHGNKVKEEQV